MLAGRRGKMKLNGRMSVYKVQYLGSCGIGVAVDGIETRESKAIPATAPAASFRFATHTAVLELLDRADGRKAYCTVTQDGIKVHLLPAGRRCEQQEDSVGKEEAQNLLFPAERIAVYSVEGAAPTAVASEARVFAWVVQLDNLKVAKWPPQFACHAAVFRSQELATEMFGLTAHFIATRYRDSKLMAKARQRPITEAPTTGPKKGLDVQGASTSGI